MLNEPADGQELIEAFFEALLLRHLEQCQDLLASLESLSHGQPMLKPWCIYLRSIMIFEVHHDWAEVEQILTKLLQTQPEPALRERVFYTFGRSLDMQGRWREAIAAFEQIIEFGQPVGKAKAWKHMAISSLRAFTQGDFDSTTLRRAIDYCQLALDLLEPIIEPSADIIWLKGSVWDTLGLIHVSLSQWDEAIACYQQDLVICRTLDDHFGMGVTYGNMGEVYQKRGNWSEALTAYQQALSLIREFKGHWEEIDVLANLAFLYQEAGENESALDYYEQTIRVIEDLRSGVSSEAAQAGFFATVIDTYANAVLLYHQTGQAAAAFDLVERARSRAFLDILAARSPALSHQMEARPMTLAEVQAALPPDALLLEYFTTGLVEAREGRAAGQQAQRHRFPPAKTLLFAVTRAEVQLYDTGLSPNVLRPSQLNKVVERHFLDPAMRRKLYDYLIAPAEGLMQGCRRLYLAPHGPLHYIPFQALLAPDGETLLREGGPQLIYTPSATLLFRYGRGEPGQTPHSCLALGYNGQGETRLRFTEEEARGVARLTGGHALVGPKLKKKTLYRQAATYRLLHFSCHGEFNPEEPLASALHLGPDETLTALDILTHLRLRCDLVTLSACESGLSRVRRGDELVGLTRAFRYAGAPALISTLWWVDERSTRILMEKFYGQLQAGAGFAEALQQAQLYLKNLTRQEVLALLARSEATTGESRDLPEPPGGGKSSFPRTGGDGLQARAYLRGRAEVGAKEDTQTGPAEENETKIFADPFYWAAFILVGEHRAGR